MEAGPRDTGQDSTRQEADPKLWGNQPPVAGGEAPEPEALGLPADPARLSPDGPDVPDTAEAEAAAGPEFEVELRPQRRLRIWQIAPIVMLAAAGSLMFAFPLAFEFGDGGAVVAMLGFLICCCAGGWGMMAARRVGHTWPGLPPRGSGRRPDWRMAGLYGLVALAVVALAVYRVARLR
ncbi:MULTISPECIES: hypothetical protein [unclassified Streptomyces]|uniref:hypothetical protein n=1 Tax=unclassified Streptomyces TaxID=2593676 RepID=UPI002E0EA1F9|nr:MULTISPECIES: hypothetical protein [unclassified Streptomyces]WSR28561.1 hypothetical protein OG573_21780 [Streptomyces sp. NBC_01205]